MRVRRIDHLAIAVSNLDEALAFYRDALGLEVSHIDVERGQGVKVAFMPVGDGEIELVEPVEPDSGVARYLDKRGPGMHHLCLEVDDLDLAIRRLIDAGVELIDTEPYVNRIGRRLVFVHPRSTFGVLIELYEVPPSATDRTPAP